MSTNYWSSLRSALCSALRKFPNFENSGWIFFHFKKFLKFFADLQPINFFKLMTDVSRNLRNNFFRKIPRFWNLKSDFCPIERVFCRFSKLPHIYFTWSLFSKIKIRETFSGAKPHNFSTWSRIFFRLKKFFAGFPNYSKFIYYQQIMSKFSSKSEQLLGEGGHRAWRSGKGVVLR